MVRAVILAEACIFQSAMAEGPANPQAGTAQFPGLLNGYVVRPAWKVAGVDYYVGTPPGTMLKDPATITIADVSANKSTHTVTVKSSNVTLAGYDFSLNGGWQVNVIDNATNVVIQNSYFEVGANNLVPIQAYYGGSIQVRNNTFDGGASHGSSVNAMVFTGDGANIQFNRFTNFPNDGIDITRGGSFVIHNNVFDAMGAGDFHTDAIQTYFGAISSLSIQYNTMYQPANISNRGINAFVRIGDQKGNVARAPVAAHNTIIMASVTATTANVFQWQGQDGPGTLVDPVIGDNFVDRRGVQYSIVAPMLQDTKGVVNPVTYNNIDLTTGKALLSGPYNNQTSGVPKKAPSAPVIMSGIAGCNQATVTGTAAPETTINIYDQGRLLGSVKANSAGAWLYTAAHLAAGDHSFAARTTDSMTNSSALSKAWLLSIEPPALSTEGARALPAYDASKKAACWAGEQHWGEVTSSDARTAEPE